MHSEAENKPNSFKYIPSSLSVLAPTTGGTKKTQVPVLSLGRKLRGETHGSPFLSWRRGGSSSPPSLLGSPKGLSLSSKASVEIK